PLLGHYYATSATPRQTRSTVISALSDQRPAISQKDSSMKIRHSFISALPPTTCLIVYLILLSAPAQAQVQAWKPIDPAHVALRAPVVEKHADPEALFSEPYFTHAFAAPPPHQL